MDARPSHFILANSPSCRVLDRFSDLPDDPPVEEDQFGRIPFWPLLRHLLGQPISTTGQLVDLLQTIGAIAESTPGNDYRFLQNFLEKGEASRIGETWSKLRDIALDVADYFPEGRLGLLEPGRPLRLSRGQVACLVAHQFLCSSVPQRDDEGYQDFGIWYASQQRHPVAIEMYLTALFVYFSSLSPAQMLMREHQSCPDVSRPVTYLLHQGPGKVSLEGVSLGPVSVDYLSKHNTRAHLPEVQGPKGGVVVSANKVIGFGQSATQEEIFTGIAPEACPVVLVAPHLSDETVVMVSGARAMLDVTGQRRELSWTVRSPVSDMSEWRGGRLIFMDALEMDETWPAEATELTAAVDVLVDVQAGRIDREVGKALAGFRALGDGTEVCSGLWGCGAFCGDAGVKVLVLWLAASAAGMRLRLAVSEEDGHDVGRWLERLAVVCCRARVSAEEMRRLLVAEEVPRGLRGVGILQWAVARVGRGAGGGAGASS